MTTVAVIGCTHAGTFAATSILAEHPDWTVHVFERNGTLSFLSCGIALWVGDHVSDPKKMFYSSPAALAEAGATMHMRTDVTDVNLDTKTITYRSLEDGDDAPEQTLAFDKLVVTTGSRPVIPPIPGIDSPHVLLCKNWDHAIAIKEKAKTAKSAVVIGSGYIGAEIAEQFSVTGQHDYIPLATNAVRQGLLVGRNIETPTVKYMGTQATSAVQLYDLSLAASGLTRAGAERRGLTVKETSLTEDYRPDFMLTTTPVTSILTWDPETRKVKGGQFCSKADISGAANVISMAIQAGFTIDQLANVDFLFQPNFDKPVYYVGAVAMKAAAE